MTTNLYTNWYPSRGTHYPKDAQDGEVAQATGKRLNILVVDDEPTILEIAEEYFRIKGFNVLTASNGKEAVKRLESEKIDCCLTDINMPEMDGLELAAYINQKDNTIPVIIMTGYPSMDNALKTLKNGVVDFLIKPVNLEQIELSIRRVLRQQALYIENFLLKDELEKKAQLESLNRTLESKVEELHILNRIMENFSTVSSTSDIFHRIVTDGVQITGAHEVVFFLINDEMQGPVEMQSSLSTGYLQDPNRLASTPRPPESLIRSVMNTQVPLLVQQNPRKKGLLPEDIESIILSPLTIREKVFGVLSALSFSGQHRFNEKSVYYLSFIAKHAAQAVENLALHENLYQNLFATLLAFVKTIEAKDPYTEQHSSRVTDIAATIGMKIGCSQDDIEVLKTAGRLHDIGKIGIRDEILLKPGRLTEEEFQEIKTHPVIGARIVGQLGLWRREQEIIRCHHERYDGKGYPNGIAGKEIPFLARILSVADVYDALASDRAYRRKMEKAEAVNIIRAGYGTQFDPSVVTAFLELCEANRL
jgi:putative nucleotidyltransferase with HDIG domain